MFIEGCAGSTAGGIKLIRVIIIFPTVFEDVFRIVHPRAITPLRISDRVLPEGVRVAVLGLFAAWFALFVLGTLLVAIQPELDSFSSATVVAATLNVIVPGLGQVGASESYEAGDYLRTRDAHGTHTARPSGDLHGPGSLLPSVLEKVI